MSDLFGAEDQYFSELNQTRRELRASKS